jgi:hypothetical protein
MGLLQATSAAAVNDDPVIAAFYAWWDGGPADPVGLGDFRFSTDSFIKRGGTAAALRGRSGFQTAMLGVANYSAGDAAAQRRWETVRASLSRGVNSVGSATGVDASSPYARLATMFRERDVPWSPSWEGESSALLGEPDSVVDPRVAAVMRSLDVGSPNVPIAPPPMPHPTSQPGNGGVAPAPPPPLQRPGVPTPPGTQPPATIPAPPGGDDWLDRSGTRVAGGSGGFQSSGVLDDIARERYRAALLKAVRYIKSVLRCDSKTAVTFIRVMWAIMKLIILWKKGARPQADELTLTLSAEEDALMSTLGAEMEDGLGVSSIDPDATAVISLANGSNPRGSDGS